MPDVLSDLFMELQQLNLEAACFHVRELALPQHTGVGAGAQLSSREYFLLHLLLISKTNKCALT